MKRIMLVVTIVLFVAAMLPAQAVDFTAFQTDFQTFAAAVAGTLASTATSTGLSWSPAYIGQFPHFGIGLSAGAGFIPYAGVKPVFDRLGVTLPAGMEFLQTYGIPLPAAALDARIGGFILPFDIGLKFGYMPPALKSLLAPVSVDFLMAGADFRFALLKDEGLVPALSVGVGYTYFKGAVGLPGIMPAGTTVDIHNFMYLAGYTGSTIDTLSFSSPDFTFDWQSNVIEAKVQLSKQLLFITPHVGLSAAYGISTAGGGISSTMTYSSDGGYTLTDLQAAFALAGYPAPTNQGIAVGADASGWSVRAFGGLDISLFFLNIDLSASYNLLTGSLGGGANLRIQF